MALIESQVVATELERVSSKLPMLFERDDAFIASIEKKNVETVSNRDMRIPLKIRPGGKFGHYNPDGGSMGRGDAQTFDKAVINCVHLREAMGYTRLAEWATDSSRKSVINVVREILATAIEEFRRNLDALAMTDGTGVMATISAVATAGNKDTYTLAAAGDGFGAKLLRYGNFYSVYNAALSARRTFANNNGTAVGGEAPIDLYDLPNKQVRFSETIAAPAIATDKIVASGLTATPPVSLLGVPYHHNNASTGTWLGFDRALTPEIRANRVTAGGGFALSHARLAMNLVGDRVGINSGVKAVAWMHPCQAQAYEALGQLVSIVQKQARAESLNLYFGNDLQMAGVPVKVHFAWDKTRIDFIVGETWGRAEMHPIGFYDVEGRRLFEARSTTDGSVLAANDFYVVVSLNTFVDNPAKCVYISGLTVPAGY